MRKLGGGWKILLTENKTKKSPVKMTGLEFLFEQSSS